MEQSTDGVRKGSIVLPAFAVVLVAILAARFLLTGQTWGFYAFLLTLPVLFFLLAWQVGKVGSLLLTSFYAVCVFVIRAFLVGNKFAILPLLLLPFLLLAVKISWNVVRALQAPREKEGEEEEE